MILILEKFYMQITYLYFILDLSYKKLHIYDNLLQKTVSLESIFFFFHLPSLKTVIPCPLSKHLNSILSFLLQGVEAVSFMQVRDTNLETFFFTSPSLSFVISFLEIQISSISLLLADYVSTFFHLKYYTYFLIDFPFILFTFSSHLKTSFPKAKWIISFLCFSSSTHKQGK